MKPITAFALLIGLTAVAATARQSASARPSSQRSQAYAPTIDPANFVTVIDNPFFALKPGTTQIYEGKTDKGFEHEEVRVSTDVKTILGVPCVTVFDTVKLDGKLKEATLDWYAQDKQGNVWYFGEDSKDYKDGKVVSTKGSWIAGVNGAQPGYLMKAKPTLGETYRQEYYKGGAEDMAKVVSLTESAVLPQGSSKNLLMVKEWSALDSPPVYEYKYYENGVGLVMVKGGTGKGWKMSLTETRLK